MSFLSLVTHVAVFIVPLIRQLCSLATRLPHSSHGFDINMINCAYTQLLIRVVSTSCIATNGVYFRQKNTHDSIVKDINLQQRVGT
jgi:hypothetical protein